MNRSATYSPTHERAFLGACLLSPDAQDLMCAEMTPDDFYVVAHQRIAEAVCELRTTSLHVNPVTVAGWIADHHGAQGLADCGGLADLVSMQVDCPSTTSAPTHALVIKDRAGRRALARIFTDGLERLADTGLALERQCATAVEAIEAVDMPTGSKRPPGLDDLMVTDRQYNWLVPGLLERKDRLMITSTESAGKSEMLWQFAVQATAGINFFSLGRMDPMRVLVIDRENTPDGIRRRLPRLLDAVEATYRGALIGEPYDRSRLFAEVDDSPLDLSARPDQRWLSARIEAVRPDLVILGPIYKLIPDDRERLEQHASQFAKYVDRLRKRYGCAFIMEHHIPLEQDSRGRRKLRPIGTSLWMRWVDFGYGFQLGDRDDKPGQWQAQVWKSRDITRRWPRQLVRAKTWPWVDPAIPDPTDPNDPAF